MAKQANSNGDRMREDTETGRTEDPRPVPATVSASMLVVAPYKFSALLRISLLRVPYLSASPRSPSPLLPVPCLLTCGPLLINVRLPSANDPVA